MLLWLIQRLQQMQAAQEQSTWTMGMLADKADKIQQTPWSTDSPSWQDQLLAAAQAAISCPGACITAPELEQRLAHLRGHLKKTACKDRHKVLGAPLADILTPQSMFTDRAYRLPALASSRKTTARPYSAQPKGKRRKLPAAAMQPSLNGAEAIADAKRSAQGMKAELTRSQKSLQRVQQQLDTLQSKSDGCQDCAAGKQIADRTRLEDALVRTSTITIQVIRERIGCFLNRS